MPTDDARKNLLAEYAVALVAERALWDRLSDDHQGEAERCRCLVHWKTSAARLKMLAEQLRAAAPIAVPAAAEGSTALLRDDDGMVVFTPVASNGIPVSTAGAVAGNPSSPRLCIKMPRLFESVRLIAMRSLAVRYTSQAHATLSKLRSF